MSESVAFRPYRPIRTPPRATLCASPSPCARWVPQRRGRRAHAGSSPSDPCHCSARPCRLEKCRTPTIIKTSKICFPQKRLKRKTMDGKVHTPPNRVVVPANLIVGVLDTYGSGGSHLHIHSHINCRSPRHLWEWWFTSSHPLPY